MSGYFAIVMHIQNNNGPTGSDDQWRTSYHLYGPFGTEQKAHSYVSDPAVLPPVDENGVHRLGLALTAQLPDEHFQHSATESTYVLVLRDLHMHSAETSLTPTLWGPFQPEQAVDFADARTVGSQGWNDVALVLHVNPPTVNG